MFAHAALRKIRANATSHSSDAAPAALDRMCVHRDDIDAVVAVER